MSLKPNSPIIGSSKPRGLWTPARGNNTPWTPANIMADIYCWNESDGVTFGTPPTVTTVLDKGPHGYDILCATQQSIAGDTFQSIPNSLGTQPALQYTSDSSGGLFALTTEMGPPQSVAIMGVNTAFTINYVGKLPSLSTNDYTAVGVVAGTSNLGTDSATIYYVNIATFPVFYFQVGTTPCVIVGTALDYVFPYTDWHKWSLVYNGGGNFNSAGNWKLWINGANVPVTLYANAGGNANYSDLGNHGDPPHIPPGYFVSQLWVNRAMTEKELGFWSSYITTKYGI